MSKFEIPAAVTTEEGLLPDDSMKGNNTFYIHCEEVGARKSYGLCLYLLDAIDKDSSRIVNETCMKAYKCGNCFASALREKEREAGKSLYYVKRTETLATPVDRPKKKYAQGQDSKFDREAYNRGYTGFGKTAKEGNKQSSGKFTPAPVNAKKPERKVSMDDALNGTGVMGLSDVVNKIMEDEKKAPERKAEATPLKIEQPKPVEKIEPVVSEQTNKKSLMEIAREKMAQKKG